MKKLNVKPVEELSQFINEAKTPGNLLQDAPDFDAIKQEEYENEGMNSVGCNTLPKFFPKFPRIQFFIRS